MQERAFAGPIAGFAALGVFWGGWAVLVPTVQLAVGASKGTLGLALLGIAVGALPPMLAFGRLIDRGLRRPLPLSLAALAGCGLLPALAGSTWTLGVALVAVGACSGLVDVAINNEVAGLEAATGRRRMQLAHGVYSLGVIGGAVVCGLLRQVGLGRLGILAAIGGIVLAAAAANLRGRVFQVTTCHKDEGAAESRGRFRPGRALLLLGLAAAAAFVVESGIENWSALFLQRTLGAGAAASAAGPASYATAMAAGRLAGQRITGRLADRTLLAGGALLSVAGLAAASLAPSVPVAAAAFFVGGAGVSVAAPIFFSAAGRLAPAPERAGAVAALTTVGYSGFLVGPPLVGGIAQAVGLRASFAALAGIALLLGLATPRLALSRGQ